MSVLALDCFKKTHLFQVMFSLCKAFEDLQDGECLHEGAGEYVNTLGKGDKLWSQSE